MPQSAVTHLQRWACGLTALIALGCGGLSEGPSATEDPALGSTATPYTLRWAQAPGFSPADRAYRIARVLLPESSFERQAFEHQGSRFEATGARPIDDDVWDEAPLAANPDLHVKYHARFNDLRVSNRKLQNIVSGDDIGSTAAAHRFEEVLHQLSAEGVLDGDYDPKLVKPSTTKFLAGEGHNAPTSTVVEYVFSVQRALGGVGIANAGVRISIHRSGAVSAVRLGGIQVDTDTARSSALESVSVGWSQRQAAARFSREYPRAHKSWDEPLYVLPDDVDSAVTLPRYVFSFANRYTHPEGDVVARRRLVGYSVTDPKSAPEELGPTPESARTGGTFQ